MDVSANPHARWPVCTMAAVERGIKRHRWRMQGGHSQSLHEKQGLSFHRGPGGPAPALLLPGLAW